MRSSAHNLAQRGRGQTRSADRRHGGARRALSPRGVPRPHCAKGRFRGAAVAEMLAECKPGVRGIERRSAAGTWVPRRTRRRPVVRAGPPPDPDPGVVLVGFRRAGVVLGSRHLVGSRRLGRARPRPRVASQRRARCPPRGDDRLPGAPAPSPGVPGSGSVAGPVPPGDVPSPGVSRRFRGTAVQVRLRRVSFLSRTRCGSSAGLASSSGTRRR